MKKKKPKATYVFIDAANIIYAARKMGWKVDFKKLIDYLRYKYQATRVFYYAGLERSKPKQLAFLELLKSFGYELKVKPVKKFFQKDNKVIKKANCDVDLTFDAMRYLGSYQQAVFLTGDGDFYVMLKFLMKKRKKVVIISHPKSTAKELKVLVGSNYVDLRSLRNKIELK